MTQLPTPHKSDHSNVITGLSSNTWRAFLLNVPQSLILGGLVRQLSLDHFENESRRMMPFSNDMSSCPAKRYMSQKSPQGLHKKRHHFRSCACCVALFLILKMTGSSGSIHYPENIHLIRGNHEAADVNALFGFRLECIERMGENDGIWAWQRLYQLFNHLPLAALIEQKIICMHGGIGRSIHSVEQIEKIERPINMDAQYNKLPTTHKSDHSNVITGLSSNTWWALLLNVPQSLILGGLVRQLSLDHFENESRRMMPFSNDMSSFPAKRYMRQKSPQGLHKKINYPENIHLIRGNHEAADVNALFGFCLECIERMGENDGIWAWQRFNQLFNHLPLAALIEQKIICMHGGIGRSIHSVEQIEKIERPINMDAIDRLAMFWYIFTCTSDPTENDSVEGLRPNARGPGLVTFEPEKVTDFCKRNKLQLIIRAHECVMDGFERFAQGQLITLFSATNYCDCFSCLWPDDYLNWANCVQELPTMPELNNAGAMLVIGRGLVVVPKLIHPLPPPLEPETSPEYVEERHWMQELNNQRPPTPTRGTANNAGAILVIGRGLVVVPKLIHPLPPPLEPETSPEYVEERHWMQELNNQRPPTPTRGRPQPDHLHIFNNTSSYYQSFFCRKIRLSV
ncbi:hypothetical protein CTI12_AA249160 [Artemisia annua]|uniref:Serine/threonine-protein phosphatase n=1 Tax=Artemisia annua TaxID=35608 RepID=A0A2U1NMT4_ARTAN|nr:hypothetical protein CTI12_AA249160 [Artemisia annua]